MPGHLVVIERLLTTHAKFLHALPISGSVTLHSENVLCIILHILKSMVVFVVFCSWSIWIKGFWERHTSGSQGLEIDINLEAQFSKLQDT